MTDSADFIRKRRVPRRSFQRKIGVLANGQYFTTFAYEVGEGGMLFGSQVKLEESQRVVLSFNIPGFVHVITRAVVRYSKPLSTDQSVMTYGVQFETIDFQAKRKIRSYVAQKSSDELRAS